MRLRKKKNLEDRLAAVESYIAVKEGSDFYYNADRKNQVKINLDAIFENQGDLYLELGCGKGMFVCEMAKKYPERNFLALEKVPNVIVSACERAYREGLKNVKFILGSAENLAYFLDDDTVSGIYLNFSCPYPKKTYANHRLTNPKFLVVYRRLMKDGSKIIQKTDNRGLFEYSLETLSCAGFRLKDVSLDLHADAPPDNVMTEYEINFVSKGLPIYKLEAYK
ncbi:MAG: tRNA (guanosine(46)-N7)-methyltransferase TrmB [Christensenellales bacterium]